MGKDFGSIYHNGKSYSLGILPKWAQETIRSLVKQREELSAQVDRLQRQQQADKQQGSSEEVRKAKDALVARGWNAGRIIHEIKTLRAQRPGLELADAIIALAQREAPDA